VARITVKDALKDLPDPRYPSQIPNHMFIKPPKRFQGKIGKLGWGRALDYFRGGNSKEYKQYMRLDRYRLAPTIMGRSRVIHAFDDRIITVREEARLMGYPDYHIFSGNLDKQFNQVGESVPPPLSRAIARYVLEKYLS
jgi:DNA (cytosine-5)-methyltransferase 1